MTPEDVRPIFGHDGKRERQRPVEIRDVAPGLWIWRLEHPTGSLAKAGTQ